MTTATRTSEFCPGCGHRLYRQEGKGILIVVNGKSHIRYALNHVVVTCLNSISRSEKCRAVVDIRLDNEPGVC